MIKKNIPVLQTFSKDILKVLYKNGIITEDKFYSIIQNQSGFKFNFSSSTNTKIEEIISQITLFSLPYH